MVGIFGLPREGLTWEILAAPVRKIALQPLLTGTLLMLLHRYPERLTNIISRTTLQKSQSSGVMRVLRVFFALGLMRSINKSLSKWVLNNWTSDKSWDWSKEIVVVTGGAGGIGERIVQMVAEKGITVIVLDIAPPKIIAEFPNVYFYQTNITSSEQIHVVAESIRAKHGEPSVLINNAGIGTNKNILDETEGEMRKVFEVNTMAHYVLVKEFVPAMIQNNHGHIVTVASLASFMVHAQNVSYTSTKASALAFHEGLGQELKSRYNAPKVRTTIVHPTWVRTPLISTLTAKKSFNEFVLEPETVAEAVVKQIMSGYGAQLILPGRFTVVPVIRALPSWWQEGMRNSVADILKL